MHTISLLFSLRQGSGLRYGRHKKCKRSHSAMMV